MKTIAQLAADIGVSKQAVYDKIKKEPLSSALINLAVKIDNTLHYDTEGELLIKSTFNKKTQSSISRKELDNNSQNKQDLIDSLKDTISILKSELANKNSQIDELTATIKNLSESINADRHNELAETVIDRNKLITATEAESSATVKKKKGLFGIFSWVKNK